jgi:CHAT domain-containing protein/Tfp pilus assembly protein PilF
LWAQTTEQQEKSTSYHLLAIEAFQEALSLYQELEERQVERDIWFDLGEAYRRVNQYSSALNAYEEALRIRQESGDVEEIEIILYRKAQMQHNLGQYEQSVLSYQLAIEICEELDDECFVYSKGHGSDFNFGTGIVDLYNGIGEAYFQQERFELALASFQKAFLRNTSSLEIEVNFEMVYEDIIQTRKAYNYYKIGIGVVTIANLALAYERLNQDDRAFEILEYLTDEDNSISFCEGYGDGAREHETLVDSIRADALQTESYDTEFGRCWTGFGTAYATQASLLYQRRDYPAAVTYYSKAKEYFLRLNDISSVSLVLNNLGVVYRDWRNYSQALASYEKALELRRTIGDTSGEATTLNNIGEIYASRGEYSKALEHYQDALTIFEDENNKQGIAAIYHNLGIIYDELNQQSLAVNFYGQALQLRQQLNDSRGIGKTLNNMGLVFEEQENLVQAMSAYQQALMAYQQIEDVIGEATTLNNIALLYLKTGKSAQSLEAINKALDITQHIDDPARLGNMMDSLGTIYRDLGRHSDAMQAYQEALHLLRRSESRAIERASLSHIGRLLDVQGQTELAIVYYKQSVNLTEEIREEIRSLPEEFQQSYTESVADTYRRLADLLLDSNRILEAQRVLDLLRVQELDDYLQDVQRSNRTETGVTYLRPEETILARYDDLQQSAIITGQELDELKAIPQSERTDEQGQRIAQLTDLLEDINGDFRDFARSPEVRSLIEQLSFEAQEASLSLNQLDRLRDELQQLNAAIFYPLILEDRLELVITVPDSPPLRRTVDVSREELNAAILEFRTALIDPRSDAAAPAQKLYDWLMRPLEADLAAAGVETIIYSPDGQLRYIPLAALHDGESWLIQQYRINNITAESLTDLTESDAMQPKILAAAYADTSLVHTPEVNGTTYTFRGLPGAGLEVDLLPTETKYFDTAFSLEAVRPILDEYSILHFATHAAFVPGVPEDSFILFGNGDTPTLRDVEDWSLNGVDLVVLSACETGVGGLGNGEEILGLGYQFQVSGAKAVMSSLWKVSDNGTQALMNAFYTAMGNGFSKAEALKRAQQAMITDDLSVVGGEGRVRAGAPPTSRNGMPVSNALPSYSHPYYWAPFILIGNGL